MKVIHFDSRQEQKEFQSKSNHIYVEESVNEYLEKNGNIQADVITGFTCSKFNKKVIDSIGGLKYIVARGIGMDHIDKEYCDLKGIGYANVDYSRDPIAHHVWALILFAVRNLEKSFTITKRGEFCHQQIQNRDLRDMTLGIIGVGRIGEKVLEVSKGFDINVVGYDIKPRRALEGKHGGIFKFVSLEELLQSSDIICISCDANESSVGMINGDTISQMKEGVILINIARGSIIKDEDLIANIKKFEFVGLDVLVDEREFSKDNEYLKYPNVCITPHVAHKSERTTKERWEKTYKLIEENFRV
jgi:D-lactate dehydrogenase